MFFVAGTKGNSTIAGSGTFYCPQCDGYMPYHHVQVHKAATVFFVSVANLSLLGEYIECQKCKGTFKMEVLNYDPQAAQVKLVSYIYRALKREMVMMMLADGDINDREAATLKHIYQKVTGRPMLDDEISEEIRTCNADLSSLTAFLKELSPYLNNEGKENLIQAAYLISISDGEVDAREMKLLRDIASVLEVSKAHFNGILRETYKEKDEFLR